VPLIISFFDLIQIGKFYLVIIYYRLLFNYFDISKGRVCELFMGRVGICV